MKSSRKKTRKAGVSDEESFEVEKPQAEPVAARPTRKSKANAFYNEVIFSRLSLSSFG